MDIPTIAIAYMSLASLKQTCMQYKNMPIDKLKIALERHAAISNSNGVEYVCIGQMLYDDFQFINNESPMESYHSIISNTYDELVDKHGQEFMDLIVTKNTDQVIASIVDLLNFMFDQVYKTDVLKVGFHDNKSNVVKSLYPSLIHSAIRQNFTIKEQRIFLNTFILLIEKRRKENVDDAN